MLVTICTGVVLEVKDLKKRMQSGIVALLLCIIPTSRPGCTHGNSSRLLAMGFRGECGVTLVKILYRSQQCFLPLSSENGLTYVRRKKSLRVGRRWSSRCRRLYDIAKVWICFQCNGIGKDMELHGMNHLGLEARSEKYDHLGRWTFGQRK